MKKYTSPAAELLLLSCEDVLTSSDNALSDIFFQKKNTEEEI